MVSAPVSRASATARFAIAWKPSSSQSSNTVIDPSTGASSSQRMVASWPSSGSSRNASTATRSSGAPAAGPSVKRVARPSSTGERGAARIAAAVARTPSPV